MLPYDTGVVVVVVVDIINVGFTEVVPTNTLVLAFMHLYSIFNLQLFLSILFSIKKKME